VSGDAGQSCFRFANECTTSDLQHLLWLNGFRQDEEDARRERLAALRRLEQPMALMP
jgi:hypothetical protein